MQGDASNGYVSGPSRNGQIGATAGVHREAVRFLLVGGTAALIDLAIYLFLLVAGLPVPIAKGTSSAVATVAAYFGNKHITYQRRAKGAGSIILFGILYSATLLLNVVVNDAMLAVLQMPTAYEIAISWTVATAASAAVNFLGMKFMIFRGARIR